MTQAQLVKKWIDVYESRKLEKLEEYLSCNHKYETFPKITGLPDETRRGYIQKYKKIFSLFDSFEAKYTTLVDIPGKVVLDITAKGTIANRTTPIEYESIAILTIVKEGENLKISRVKGFCNPEKRAALYSWAAQALAV